MCDITIYIFDIYVDYIYLCVCVYVCIYDNYRGEKKRPFLVAGLKESFSHFPFGEKCCPISV